MTHSPGLQVAAFDVDGTVTTRDCVVPYMRRVTGTPRIVAHLATRPHRLIPVLARRDRDRLKMMATSAAFGGRRVDELEAVGVEFARHVRDHWIRPDTLDALTAHIDAGDRVVFVSASYEIYLRPLATLLGVHAVLATRLVAHDGVATGAIDGLNCRGPEKVRRLHEWMRTEHGGRDCVRLVAYGDSTGDREMLADADEEHWVSSSRRTENSASVEVSPGATNGSAA